MIARCLSILLTDQNNSKGSSIISLRYVHTQSLIIISFTTRQLTSNDRSLPPFPNYYTPASLPQHRYFNVSLTQLQVRCYIMAEWLGRRCNHPVEVARLMLQSDKDEETTINTPDVAPTLGISKQN